MSRKAHRPSARITPLGRQRRLVALLAVVTLFLGLFLSAREYLPALLQALKGTSISLIGLEALTRISTLAPILGFLGANVAAHLIVFSLPLFSQRVIFTEYQRIRDSALVTAFLTTLLLISLSYVNESLFPGSSANILGLRENGFIPSAIGLGSLAITITLISSGLAMLLFRMMRSRPKVFSALAIMTLLGLFNSSFNTGLPDTRSKTRPNIILIGIDSLRPDHVWPMAKGANVAPNMSSFMKEATVFSNASTIIGRSFPSWLSVFSGQYPHVSGARYNLQPPTFLSQTALLPQILREHGYATVYATDETRFANIDERFGFDHVISPGQGLEDFLIISFADIPLVNLLSNAPFIEAIFPTVSMNRQSKSYMPGTFSRVLHRRLGTILHNTDQPIFLVVDFAVAHYPYHAATWDAGRLINPLQPQIRHRSIPKRYAHAVSAADKQFGSLMNQLEEASLLDSATTILFSDHGENLGEGASGYTVHTDAKISFGLVGHGISIFDDLTHHVVLAIQDSRPTQLGGQNVAEPVELVDIAPTLLSLAGIDYSAHELSGNDLTRDVNASQYRLRESGIRLLSLMGASIDETSVAKEAMENYRVTREGLLEIRPDLHEQILSSKQRGLEYDSTMIAYLEPAGVRTERQWIVVDRDAKAVYDFEDFPDRGRAIQLLQAFCDVYMEDPYLPMTHEECLATGQ